MRTDGKEVRRMDWGTIIIAAGMLLGELLSGEDEDDACR